MALKPHTNITPLKQSTEIVEVTPALAEKWLEANTHNRSVSQTRVDAYAADMKAGAWRLTHQGVAFGADGTLYDGQHRLWAVFQAGVTVKMRVTWGLDESTREVIDTMRGRSVADNMYLTTGDSQSKRLVTLANTLRLIVGENARHGASTYREAQGMITRFEEDFRWVLGLGKNKFSAGVTATLALARKTNPTKVEEFADQLVRGIELHATDPAYALRRWLLEQPATTSADRREAARKTAWMIVLHILGRTAPAHKVHGSDEALAWFASAHGYKLSVAYKGGLRAWLNSVAYQPRRPRSNKRDGEE